MLSKPIKEYKCPKCGKITTQYLYPDEEIHLKGYITCGECKTTYRLDENKTGEYSIPEHMSTEEYIKLCDSKLFDPERASSDKRLELLNSKLYDNDEKELSIRRGLWWDLYDEMEEEEVFIKKYKTAYELNCIRLIELDKNGFIELFTMFGDLWERSECMEFFEAKNNEELIKVKEKILNYAKKRNE
jgi:DNA-directed RNA polymerase subunit RPC12/RpoP